MKLRHLFINLRYVKLILVQNSLLQAMLYLFIPGTYRRKWKEGQFEVTETITIKQISAAANLYDIEREKVKQHSPWDGKHHPEIRETEAWMAVYKQNTGQLQELNNGVECSFLPEKNLLFLGKQVYSKMKGS